MAKKIGFGLEMKEDVKVRDIEALRENFDIDKAMEHFASGKLVEWLENRFCDEEADKIKAIDKTAPTDVIKRHLCEALGVDMSEANVDEGIDMEIAQRNNEKKDILRQRTSDQNIIAHAAQTAFNQGDLADLWNMDEPTIFLCGNSFKIRSRITDRTYVGVLSTPKIEIDVNSREEFVDKGIKFENVELPAHLQEKKLAETTSCPKCGKENPSSAKFCNTCGTAMNESQGTDAPHTSPTQPAKKEWKIPKSQLKTMFVATFKEDFDYFRGHEKFNPNGIDDNATFFMVGSNNNVTNNLTDDQKNLALNLICGGQYTEDDLIHLRIKDDMSQGWAFTLDSFCFVACNGIAGIIPYQSITIKPYELTLILNDGQEVRQFDLFTSLYTNKPLFKVLTNMKNMFQSRA